MCICCHDSSAACWRIQDTFICFIVMFNSKVCTWWATAKYKKACTRSIPLDVLGTVCRIWCYMLYFLSDNRHSEMMWSMSHQTPSLPEDIFPGTQFRLGLHGDRGNCNFFFLNCALKWNWTYNHLISSQGECVSHYATMALRIICQEINCAIWCVFIVYTE